MGMMFENGIVVSLGCGDLSPRYCRAWQLNFWPGTCNGVSFTQDKCLVCHGNVDREQVEMCLDYATYLRLGFLAL